MQDLRVTIIQSPLHWKSISANLAMFEEKIWQIDQETDLIILPEMFNTGFTMDVEELAEPMNFITFKWMKQMAAQTKAVLTGSFIVKENNRFYNRLIWMQPDGTWNSYDKRHLFRMANEHEYFDSGEKKIIQLLKGWRICPLICYDLRFPVWARNNDREKYDLLIYAANWPSPRVKAWDTLLSARAIENLSYCIGVNRIGKDGNGIKYSGHSAAYDAKGNTLTFLADTEDIETLQLSASSLIQVREKFPTHLDADDFTIN